MKLNHSRLSQALLLMVFFGIILSATKGVAQGALTPSCVPSLGKGVWFTYVTERNKTGQR